MDVDAVPPLFSVLKALTSKAPGFWQWRGPRQLVQEGLWWAAPPELPVGEREGLVPWAVESLEHAWERLQLFGLVPEPSPSRTFVCRFCTEVGCIRHAPDLQRPHSYAALVGWAALGCSNILKIEEIVRHRAREEHGGHGDREVAWVSALHARAAFTPGGWAPYYQEPRAAPEPYRSVVAHGVLPRYAATGPLQLHYPEAWPP